MPNPLRSTLPPAAAHLIASIFYGLAAFLLYMGTDTMQRVHAARDWVEVPARMVNMEMDVQRNVKTRGAASQRLKGLYTYMWEGKEYRNGTMEFSSGSNNFSQERQDRQWAKLRGPNLTVYVNPLDPSESVLDPTLPAPLMAFYSVFLVFPCFLGVVWVWYMPTMLVRRGEEAPFLQALASWGSLATLLYLPTASMVFFPMELGVAQWLIFAALFVAVLGVRTIVGYFTPKLGVNPNQARAK